MSFLKKFKEIFDVRTDTRYSHGIKLQVVENDEKKIFNFDGATHSVIRKGQLYTGGFWDYFIPIVYTYKNPRILMIGLGIGTTPYQLHMLFGNRIRLDVVENDREVVKLARKHAPNKITDTIFVEDGCDYVVRSKNKYDIILLDAYTKGARIPKQFYTEKFVKNAYRILNANGILAINYATHPYGIIKMLGYKRLLHMFPKVYRVKVKHFGDTEIILCSKKMGREDIVRKVRLNMKINKDNSQIFESYTLMKKV